MNATTAALGSPSAQQSDGANADPVSVGYYTNWSLYGRGFMPKDIDASKYTHIQYSFIGIGIDENQNFIDDRYEEVVPAGQPDAGRFLKLKPGAGLLTDTLWDNQTGQPTAQPRCVLSDPYADILKIFFADKGEDVDGQQSSWMPDPDLVDEFGLGRVRHGAIAQFQELKAANPDLKVTFSLGGWSMSQAFRAASTPSTIDAFAQSCVDLTRKAGFDGIDVDWEFPGTAGDETNPPMFNGSYQIDTDQHLALMQTLRNKLDIAGGSTKHYELSMASGPGIVHADGLKAQELAEIVDWIGLMAYDYNGAWTPVAAHNAPLYGPGGSGGQGGIGSSQASSLGIDEVVDHYINNLGYPADKLVLGVGQYGRSWGGIPAGEGTLPGLYQNRPQISDPGNSTYPWGAPVTTPGTDPDQLIQWLSSLGVTSEIGDPSKYGDVDNVFLVWQAGQAGKDLGRAPAAVTWESDPNHSQYGWRTWRSGQYYNPDTRVGGTPLPINEGFTHEKLANAFYGIQTTAPFSWEVGVLDFATNGLVANVAIGNEADVADLLSAPGWTRYWDSAAKVPYLYNATTKEFVSYDDARSAQLKGAYAKHKGLRGFMYWSIDGDRANELPAASRAGMNLGPIIFDTASITRTATSVTIPFDLVLADSYTPAIVSSSVADSSAVAEWVEQDGGRSGSVVVSGMIPGEKVTVSVSTTQGGTPVSSNIVVETSQQLPVPEFAILGQISNMQGTIVIPITNSAELKDAGSVVTVESDPAGAAVLHEDESGYQIHVSGLTGDDVAVVRVSAQIPGRTTPPSTTTLEVSVPQIPTFGAFERTATGFTFPIVGYDATKYEYTADVVPSLPGVAATLDPSTGIVTVTGLTLGQSASVRVSMSDRSGKYAPTMEILVGSALDAAPVVIFGATEFRDGKIIVPISNSSQLTSENVTLTVLTTTDGVVQLLGNGQDGWYLEISGLQAGQNAQVSVRAERANAVPGLSNVTVGSSIAPVLANPATGIGEATIEVSNLGDLNAAAAEIRVFADGTENAGNFSAVLNPISGVITVRPTSELSTVTNVTITVEGQAPGKAPVATSSTVTISPVQVNFENVTPTKTGFTFIVPRGDLLAAAEVSVQAAAAPYAAEVSPLENGDFQVTVTGVPSNSPSTATVTYTRQGVVLGRQQVTATSATAKDITFTLGSITRGETGFTALIEDYDPSAFTYILGTPTVTDLQGAVSPVSGGNPTAVISNDGLISVTGLRKTPIGYGPGLATVPVEVRSGSESQTFQVQGKAFDAPSDGGLDVDMARGVNSASAQLTTSLDSFDHYVFTLSDADAAAGVTMQFDAATGMINVNNMPTGGQATVEYEVQAPGSWGIFRASITLEAKETWSAQVNGPAVWQVGSSTPGADASASVELAPRDGLWTPASSDDERVTLTRMNPKCATCIPNWKAEIQGIGATEMATVTTTFTHPRYLDRTVTYTFYGPNVDVAAPVFGEVRDLSSTGFAVQILNFNPNYTYKASAPATVEIDSEGLVTVRSASSRGLVTVTVQVEDASGSLLSQGSVSQRTLRAPHVPVFSKITSTTDGVTAELSYENSDGPGMLQPWQLVNEVAVIDSDGNPVPGATGVVNTDDPNNPNGVIIVTGLKEAVSARVEVTSYRLDGAGKLEVAPETRGFDVRTGLTRPILGEVQNMGPNGFTVPIANYNPQDLWTATANAPAKASVSPEGFIVVEGAYPRTLVTVTVARSRDGVTSEASKLTVRTSFAAAPQEFTNITQLGGGFSADMENAPDAVTLSNLALDYDATVTDLNGTPIPGANVDVLKDFEARDWAGRVWLVVSGLNDGVPARVTVTSSLWENGSYTVPPATTSFESASLSAAEAPLLEVVDKTFDGLLLRITNHDSASQYAAIPSAGVAYVDGDTVRVSSLNAGETVEVTVTAARPGSLAGAVPTSISNAALEAPSAPAVTDVSTTGGATPAATWSKPTESFSGYEISLDGGASHVEVGAEVTDYLPATVPSGEFSYSIRSYVDAPGINGNSVRFYSDWASVTVPAAPAVGAVTQTVDGYTFTITNYTGDGSAYSVSSSEGQARLDAGTVYVTGLPVGGTAAVDVSVTNSDGQSRVTSVSGTALAAIDAPELTWTSPEPGRVDVRITNFDPNSDYTATLVAGTGTVSRQGDTIVVTDIEPGISVVVEVSVQDEFGRQAKSETSPTAMGAGIEPQMGQPSFSASRIAVAVQNMADLSDYTVNVTADKGNVAIVNGIISVTGFTPGDVVTITVTSEKAGSATREATMQVQTLNLGMKADVAGAVTRTEDGFTFVINNFDALTAAGLDVSVSVADPATVDIDGSGLVTVKGLEAGRSTFVNVTTSGAGFESNSVLKMGRALEASSAPQKLSAPDVASVAPRSGGVTFTIGNWDSANSYDVSTSKGAAQMSGSLVTVTGLGSQESVTITVSVSRDGFEGAKRTFSARAGDIAEPVVLEFPRLGTPIPGANGFEVSIDNFNPSLRYSAKVAGSGTSSIFTLIDSGKVHIDGADPGQSVTVAVFVSNGTEQRVSWVRGKALDPQGGPEAANPAAPTPILTDAVSIVGGFQVRISNFATYGDDFQWTTETTATGAKAERLGDLITVSGIQMGLSAELTVSVSGPQHTASSAQVIGTAKRSNVDAPMLGAPTVDDTTGDYLVAIANYDPQKFRYRLYVNGEAKDVVSVTNEDGTLRIAGLPAGEKVRLFVVAIDRATFTATTAWMLLPTGETDNPAEPELGSDVRSPSWWAASLEALGA